MSAPAVPLLRSGRVVQVQVTYALGSRNIDVTSNTDEPDEVLAALQRALYATLLRTVHLR